MWQEVVGVAIVIATYILLAMPKRRKKIKVDKVDLSLMRIVRYGDETFLFDEQNNEIFTHI